MKNTVIFYFPLVKLSNIPFRLLYKHLEILHEWHFLVFDVSSFQEVDNIPSEIWALHLLMIGIKAVLVTTPGPFPLIYLKTEMVFHNRQHCEICWPRFDWILFFHRDWCNRILPTYYYAKSQRRFHSQREPLGSCYYSLKDTWLSPNICLV